jgi:hypothetical protein
MRRSICLAIYLSIGGAILALMLQGQSVVVTLISENFDDISDWKDLSLAVSWGDNTKPTSAFSLSEGTISLKQEAFKHTSYSTKDSLKTFTALDRQFPTPFDRTDRILTIDFQARWNTVESTGSGEDGRAIVALNYAYPSGGIPLDFNDKYNDFDRDWWALPAYHLRIRAGGVDNTQGTTLLQYGGGLTAAGEYERYDNSSTSSNPDWWLPGFISGVNGTSPGMGDDYPASNWVATSKGVATTSFSRYRYVIEPDSQKFWFDANNDGIFQTQELMAAMPLPLTNINSAPLYQYFPKIEGIRLYWRGSGGASRGQVFLDNLTVTTSAIAPRSRLAVIIAGIPTATSTREETKPVRNDELMRIEPETSDRP